MQELKYAFQHNKNSSPDEDTYFADMVKIPTKGSGNSFKTLWHMGGWCPTAILENRIAVFFDHVKATWIKGVS